MKKRLLAVVLAFCMVASACILFANAAEKTATKDHYYVVKGLTAPALTDGKYDDEGVAADLGTTTPSVSAVENPPSQNTQSHIDITNSVGKTLVKVTPSTLADYLDFGGSLNANGAMTSATGSITVSLKSGYSLWRFDGTNFVSASVDGSPVSVTVKLATKLYTIKTGVRFSGNPYDNLVADEIAVVEAEVIRSGMAPVKMVVNEIRDLTSGDEVILRTSLKGENGSYVYGKTEDDFYKFQCWVNGNGEVIGYSPEINRDQDGNYLGAGNYYALYVEKVDRHRITFDVSDNGKVVAKTNEVNKREIFEGKDQVSVLHGKDVTFNLQPDEGYQVGSVIVTGADGVSRNITSLAGLLTGETNWQTLIRATLTKTLGTEDKGGTIKSESLGTPTYTFEKVDQDYTIKVNFIKVAALEAGKGKDMPMITPEGLTLMSAEEAVSEAEAAKAAAGEAGGTTVPAENGAAGAAGSAGASGSVVNPATGSTTSAVVVFAVLATAAGAAFVTLKKKED